MCFYWASRGPEKVGHGSTKVGMQLFSTTSIGLRLGCGEGLYSVPDTNQQWLTLGAKVPKGGSSGVLGSSWREGVEEPCRLGWRLVELQRHLFIELIQDQ
jgi:hypothetical protein